MSAEISEPESNTSQIQVSGAYKDYTGGSGSTTTEIQYDSGEAPEIGDKGRFLMWRADTTNTGTWEIRYIEGVTETTVRVGDGGFSSAPPNGAKFRMSSNLEDINTAINDQGKLQKNGTHYEFVNREWLLTDGAFLADVDKSIAMTNTDSGVDWIPPAFQVRAECAVQFGRLKGGEGNDSVETTQGCRLALQSTNNKKLIFGTRIATATDAKNDDDVEVGDILGADEYDALGCILNFYGCQIEASHGPNPLFIRAGGPLRMIGTIVDGDIGGRFYSDASELVDCRLSGNSSGAHAWSSATTLTRDILNTFFFANNTAIKSLGDYKATFKNCRFSDSNTKIIQADASSDLNFKFIDCTTFADSKISANKGNYEQGKSINYEITDSSGVVQSNVLVAVYDKNGLVQTGVQTSSSGVVPEIQAIFFNKPDGSGASNLAPFDIRIRKYGKTYLGFQSAVSEPIKQEIRLVDNANLVSTKSQAQAISGISLDFTNSTLTLTENHSAQALYDYYQYQLGESENMQYAEDFTKSGSSFDLGDWDLEVDGCTYTGDITTSGTITRSNDGKIIGTAKDASGTVVLLPWEIKNVEATSRIQLVNASKSNALVHTEKLSGSAGDFIDVTGSYNGSQISVGDVIRLRVTCVVAKQAMLPVEKTGVATATGITFQVDQQADEIYNSNDIDGSTVSTLTADYSVPQMGVDINDGDSTASVKEIYAFFTYATTTADGVDKWFGGIRAIDNANYEVKVDNADIKLQNISATSSVVVIGGRMYRDDGESILYAEAGNKPIVMDSGAMVTSIQPQVEAGLNANAKISSINNNSKLIPSLL
jgi:hypothetical protein